MAAISWSNPEPGKSAADFTSGFKVDAPNISGVVAAILEDRYRKQKMFQDTLNQVDKTIGDQRDSELHNKLIEAQIKELGSRWGGQMGELGPRTWASPGGHTYAITPHGGLGEEIDRPPPPITPEQEMTNARAQRQAEIEAAKGLFSTSGYDPRLLTSKTDVYEGGKTGPADYQGGGAMIPPNQYLVNEPDKDGTVHYSLVPKAGFDAAHAGYDKYQQLLTAPVTAPSAQGAQGGEAQGSQYPAPSPEAIKHLQANPQLAPAFEQKYGPGSSNGLIQ